MPRHPHCSVRRRASSLVLLTAVLAAAAQPVASADEENESVVALSPDGLHWSAALEAPLFDSALRWVPGDVRTAQFWVRNNHPDRGRLTVDVERVQRDSLIRTGSLQISARAGGRAWSTVAAGGLQELLNDDDLASGEPVPIEIRVRMDDDAPNGTMVLSTDLDLSVTVADAEVVAGESGENESGGGNTDESSGSGEGSTGSDSSESSDGSDGSADGFLPATGSDIPPWLPPLGFVLLGSGAFLLARRRREEQTVPCVVLEEGRYLT